ncbi:glycosyltransferase family 10-domain-containing protein [Catenaria anguillulae PL171]|uniref:Fucosyltransferase n=1 Tax=Catenaria anguillulae PL171 TaxID=765915 RepID=A0A1Y2H925_9FUNG|nr:glycosyltransferase family 10-domain-containing protein [Catenaria anguillulae PL171]
MSAKLVFRALVLTAVLAAVWLLSALVGLGPSSFSSTSAHHSDPLEPVDPHQVHDRAKALAATSAAPTRILAWTKVSGTSGFEAFHINFCGADAPSCIVTHHRALLNDSAAVLFSSTDLDPLDLPTSYPKKYGARDPLQPWVLYSEVSPLEHPAPYPLLDPSWTRLFDYAMSYRLDSDFPIPAISGADLVAALSAPLDTRLVESRFHLAQSHRPAPILWLASPGSCTSDNHRHLIVSALEAAGLAVDSLNGACPTRLGRAVTPPDGNLVALIQQYKFVLVLETSNCKDYVSRSLVHALQAQSLAIVDGPPLASYQAILGNSRLDTVIVADSPSTNTSTSTSSAADPLAHLVQLVSTLATSKQAYLTRMRAARAEPLDPAWHARWTSPQLHRGRRSGWCAVCAAAASADALRVAERAYQDQAYAARQAAESRLAASMAEVDVMRSELVTIVKQHATSSSVQRKRLAAKFGQRTRAWNATTWRNASSYLPLPSHPLAHAPRKHVPEKRPVLIPDYSCQLGKWAPAADADPSAAHVVARYKAQGLPGDFLAHALPEAAPEVKWPRPVGRRKRGKSRYADLTGELVVVGGGRQPSQGAGMASGAQVMDPSEAEAGVAVGDKPDSSDEPEEQLQQRKPRLELEYPPMDQDDDDQDGTHAKRGAWDMLDGVLVGLFVTGMAGMFASALGLNTNAAIAASGVGAGSDVFGIKRKRVTSLTSAMAAAASSGKQPMSPPQGVRLLPLRRQSVTHGGGHHPFVTSPVQEETEEGANGFKVL